MDDDENIHLAYGKGFVAGKKHGKAIATETKPTKLDYDTLTVLMNKALDRATDDSNSVKFSRDMADLGIMLRKVRKYF
jgi:hypothetical protein